MPQSNNILIKEWIGTVPAYWTAYVIFMTAHSSLEKLRPTSVGLFLSRKPEKSEAKSKLAVQGFLQFERKREMKMVLTSEVENVDNWLANRQERHATISQFAENIVEYTNEDGSGVVALTFNITDEKKMNDIMQDNKTRAEMIRHGVKPETITSFIEK